MLENRKQEVFKKPSGKTTHETPVNQGFQKSNLTVQ